MTRADRVHSTPPVNTSAISYDHPPPEAVGNTTLDPMGRQVLHGTETMFRLDKMVAFESHYLTRHAIADEVERLLAILDQLDGDGDFELNVGNNYNDPRLEDAEDDGADEEPSLAGFGTEAVCRYFIDCELDDSESGIADLGGLSEQMEAAHG